MATTRQIEANQRNAQLSSGPKTQAGKAVAALNALKHGLLATDAMLPGESASDFEELTEKLYGEMRPVGELESALVGRIVGLIWRLKRTGRMETGILLWHQAKVDPDSWGRTDVLKRARTLGSVTVAEEGEAYMASRISLAKLSRYETSLERSLYRALHQFQRLQAASNGGRTPIVVDVKASEKT